MSTRYDKSEFLSFASCQLSAESNEDRISTCMNHGSGGFESFSSFGVFDGHQGVSDVCVTIDTNRTALTDPIIQLY